VFLSQSDGTYRFSPLPREAQIAPLFGLVAGDFDGDGKTDLYAVQNSFSPIPATGRFDGGLSVLLRGDGAGKFEAVPPRVSGLVVPANAKGLALVDLEGDGWPDFIVTRNNNTGLVFKNRGLAHRHSVRVVLKSTPSHVGAIGARVTFRTDRGPAQTAEVYCGSGYLSQSTAALFFGWEDSDSPRELRIFWPNGKESTHAWTGGKSEWTVTPP